MIRLAIPVGIACGLMLAGCSAEPPRQAAVPPARPLGPRTVAPSNGPVLDKDSVLGATRSAIVVVESLDRRGHVVAQGSGVIVVNRTVVTSWPLVSRAFAIRIRHGDDVRPATLTAALESHGLVRLSADAKGTLDLGRDASPSSGAEVYPVGSAQGFEITVVQGIVSRVREGKTEGVDRIETTVSWPAGFTGGGLFDSRGELIGVLTWTGAGELRGLAVPVRYVKDLLALPPGTLPKPRSSPLLRLPAADRRWLIDFMAGVVKSGKPLSGLGLDRVNALLDRLDPLVGAELDWVKVELGLGLLRHQRLFWEDAIEARAFRRSVKSEGRAAVEKSLLDLSILSPREVAESDAIMRAIAARETFETPGARIDATERYLSQMMSQTDQTKRRVETQIWEARSR